MRRRPASDRARIRHAGSVDRSGFPAAGFDNLLRLSGLGTGELRWARDDSDQQLSARPESSRIRIGLSARDYTGPSEGGLWCYSLVGKETSATAGEG